MLPSTDFMNDTPCMVLIHADHFVDATPTDEAPTLKEMQEYVQGYVQLIPQKNNNDVEIQIYGNEEGMIKGLEENTLAPTIIEEITGNTCPHRLYGTIVLLVGSEVCWE